jgi:NAD+ synthase (glutamine-hydrolysing)
LREGQRDEDSLPPYSQLDQVLEAYVELDRSREELSTTASTRELVGPGRRDDRPRRSTQRRQAPPSACASRPKAFGRDRRTPITNRWRG